MKDDEFYSVGTVLGWEHGANGGGDTVIVIVLESSEVASSQRPVVFVPLRED
jgi:hypothetical protein